ncbi:hypothetical protein GDO86_017237 [Hymenochirus boettgeri]|uniref:Methyltransferase-like protein 22 n=1 Tax=Hymenochirus boettgeri TaxID=247094 RepID=A0A8T2IPT7_9PIPI|nr:hypothetical protein GDO86_017237 [Hymenochirus boettgeri]
MEVFTFTKDTVLSEVHLYFPHRKHFMVRLNAVGQPVFQSTFKILCNSDTLEEFSQNEKEAENKEDCACPEEDFQTNDVKCAIKLLDEDGDLEVLRKPQSVKQDYPRDIICPTILTIANNEEIHSNENGNGNRVVRMEHTLATPLGDVGKQIWRGAFLLADYILSNSEHFKGCTALELGAGTGFTSIILSMVANTIYCTDVGEDLLEMCMRNVTLNRNLPKKAGGEVKVKEMDWLKKAFSSDSESPYSWNEEDIANLHDHMTVIIAADVIYDDDLTDALFNTIYRIAHSARNPCRIYLSTERRYNFTLRQLDITCDAYNHFRSCLKELEDIIDGKIKFTAKEIKPSFPQFFSYERIEQLVSDGNFSSVYCNNIV